jgi:multidrug efflux pump
MLGVTMFGLFLTPVFYVVLRRLTERRRAAAAHEHAEVLARGGDHA